MTMIRFASVLLLWFLFRSVWLFGVDFSCPSEFKEGENVVSCKINRTAVLNANCVKVQSQVTFELTVGSQSVPMCYTPSFNSSNCNPVLKPAKNTCWCNGTKNDIFDYNFVFTANQSRDQGALLECKICFLPAISFENKTDDSCTNLRFSSAVINKGWTVGHIVAACTAVFALSTLNVITIVCQRRRPFQRCILKLSAPLQANENRPHNNLNEGLKTDHTTI